MVRSLDIEVFTSDLPVNLDDRLAGGADELHILEEELPHGVTEPAASLVIHPNFDLEV